MDKKSLGFVSQLIEKTEQGKLSWSAGFEDEQFKTLLPGGKLAFVIQAKGEVRKFRMLDERLEVILEETVTFDQTAIDHINSPNDNLGKLYEAIGRLQQLARNQALKVNEKLAQAEKLLAAI